MAKSGKENVEPRNPGQESPRLDPGIPFVENVEQSELRRALSELSVNQTSKLQTLKKRLRDDAPLIEHDFGNVKKPRIVGVGEQLEVARRRKRFCRQQDEEKDERGDRYPVLG